MSLVAIRKAFPYFAIAVLAVALIYATSFGTLPRADFTFNNMTEVKTVDPAKATGEPEGRVLEGLFEGLLRRKPEPGAPPPSYRANTPVTPQLATADDMKLSDDGRTYTFHIRDSAKWSDGSPVTSYDFAWSWQRMLHPDTASEYAYQLHYIVGAKAYTDSTIGTNDSVEVELDDRPNSTQTFPRGTIVQGVLAEISAPFNQEGADLADATTYVVQTRLKRRAFARNPAKARESFTGKEEVEKCTNILPDFDETVGIKTPDDLTLNITLTNPTPYFPQLLAFYPLYPVNRLCVETYGSPEFTKPENLVTNGPFTIQFRRIRDRLRMVKNPHYWDAANVAIETVDALAISSDVTALNMYLTGHIDWSTNVPPTVIADLNPREDFHTAPIFATYFYRINCTRPPLDNPQVRRALNMAIDKQKLCDRVTLGGESPATSLVPPSLPSYKPAQGPGYDPNAARKLLADAGYPNGQGLKKIEILYNTNDTHQVIAEVVQAEWKRVLGIEVELRPLEWATYLSTQHKLDYDVCRAGWTGDYLDPNTFIDMFVTDGENNQTGWSNAKFDQLVTSAAAESDVEKRLQLLRDADQILIDEQPFIPLYSYTSKEMVKPYVSGLYLNLQKFHPLHFIKIDREMRDSMAGGIQPMMYLVRRIAWILITLWVVYTATFAMMRAVPGGPFSSERKTTPAIERNLAKRYKTDDPILVQYWDHLSHAMKFDFGASYKLEDYTVNEIIAQGLPISASLGILALTFALVFGVLAGVVSAARRNSAIDVAFMGVAALGVAVPSFVLAGLAIILFVFGLAWLPAGGWGTIKQLLLPAACLAAPIAAYIARLTRAGMLDVLSLDYIRTAFSKGLSERSVLMKHAIRGAMLPVISYLGPAAAGLLTGSVVIERIFNIPGLGTHFVESAMQRDYTLAQGVVIVYTLILLVLNTFVDFSYALIDPRVKVE